MSLNDFPCISLKINPFKRSVFVQRFDGDYISPGNQEFLLTEDGQILLTEDNVGITTE